jgi:hypothetical protein
VRRIPGASQGLDRIGQRRRSQNANNAIFPVGRHNLGYLLLLERKSTAPKAQARSHETLTQPHDSDFAFHKAICRTMSLSYEDNSSREGIHVEPRLGPDLYRNHGA